MAVVASIMALMASATGPAVRAADDPPSGATRVGIVLPKAQLGQGSTGADVAAPVRETLISYLRGPALEIVPLAARIPAQVTAEARAAGCRYVLYTAVAQKGHGSGMGGMFRKLAPMAGMLPMAGSLGGMGGASTAMAAGMVAQTASTMAAQSAADEAMAQMTHAQAGTIKARDEVSVEFKLIDLASVDPATPVVGETLKATAQADGEDLIGPLLEKVAVSVVDAAQRGAVPPGG